MPKPPILVAAPLAEKTKPNGTCPEIDNYAVDPLTLMPKDSSYHPVFQLRSTGLRNYSCADGTQLDLNSLAIANFTGDFVGDINYNSDRLPQLTLYNQNGTAAGTMVMEANRLEFKVPGVPLSWGRRNALVISGPEIPWVIYSVMGNTTGGAPPTPDACQGQPWVTVPFEATYTYYSC